MPEMKNIPDEIKGRLDIAERKFENLKDIAVETIQDEIHREKRIKKKTPNH